MSLHIKYPEPKLLPVNDAGDWYRNKRHAADYWLELLQWAREHEPPLDEEDINYMRSRLADAREVGD